LINIFLRDAFYTTYLNLYYKLEVVEYLLEIPLDSITAKNLRDNYPGSKLPRWLGVKHLSVEISDCYQNAANEIAQIKSIARVI